MTGLIQPDAKLALYEAEDEAGLTDRGVIFTKVCQPDTDLYKMLFRLLVPQILYI